MGLGVPGELGMWTGLGFWWCEQHSSDHSSWTGATKSSTKPIRQCHTRQQDQPRVSSRCQQRPSVAAFSSLCFLRQCYSCTLANPRVLTDCGSTAACILNSAAAQVPFNPRLRDSPKIDIVAPLKGQQTFVAPNAKVGHLAARKPAATAAATAVPEQQRQASFLAVSRAEGAAASGSSDS